MAWTPIKLRSGGDVRFVGEAEGAGGGSRTYVRKTLTFADFLTPGFGTIADVLAIPEGDVLVSVAVAIPVAFDFTGAASGLTFQTTGSVILGNLAVDLSSDTTTGGPGTALYAFALPPGAAGGSASLPATGGVGGSTLTVACASFANDGTGAGLLVLLAELVTPTDLP